MNALEALADRMKVTAVCAGIDPDISAMPAQFREDGQTPEEGVWSFLIRYIELVAGHVCAFKVQKAFFDKLAGGQLLLEAVIRHIHGTYPGLMVFVDCKIGDTGNTMEAYRENLFGILRADGVVANPYMGDEAIMPLAAQKEKAVLVLVRTSNPGAAIIQDVRLADRRMLWQHVLDQVVRRWNDRGNLVPILSSTDGFDHSATRSGLPQTMPILLAGVGAQGGSLENFRLLLNEERSGVFVNSSRELMYPTVLPGQSWEGAVEQAVQLLKGSLNERRAA